jgi:hypothetical protein
MQAASRHDSLEKEEASSDQSPSIKYPLTSVRRYIAKATQKQVHILKPSQTSSF